MSALYMIIGTLIALGVLVTFHEFGHFWVARRCGVKVLRFSVGFGTPLVRWQDRQGTEFVIAAIPLGGYVKMLDEREGDVPAHLLEQSFNRKTVRQRIAITAAGPIANFLLAIVFFWALAMLGSQQVRPVIGGVEAGSLAAAAGLSSGQACGLQMVEHREGLDRHVVEAAAQGRIPQHQGLPRRALEGLAALVQALCGCSQRSGLGCAVAAEHHELLQRVQSPQRADPQQAGNQHERQQQQLLEGEAMQQAFGGWRCRGRCAGGGHCSQKGAGRAGCRYPRVSRPVRRFRASAPRPAGCRPWLR